MRQPLDKALRKKLEDTVVKARDIVENAVNEALQRLGVAEAQAPAYLSEEERNLRRDLRAHARQLGDKLQDGKQEVERLTNEMAYEHWHRMLFARYLEQNNLLMYDEHTPVTLEECFELAEEESDCKDGWELAGRLAQKMLPQIFRADSPVFKVKLSINRVNELEELIAKLDPATYQAQDSLGWCYQFWQTKKKEQVNKSGVKIGAQELSPVTQLFTEPYMVSFLLDNALGAWWANKRLSQDDLIRANNEQELRELASIPGVPLEYLRFSKDEDAGLWKPAAGGFEKWPEHLSELKTLDPCCGSGHFLVAVFLMLVPMRMQLEGLSEKQAVDAVLRDNIHGLELDQRCVELAAFALALEAWRYPNAGGYRVLPELQLACSGMSIAEAQKEWKDLVKGDEALTDAIAWMQHTFKDAPTLGSLIKPNKDLNGEANTPWKVLQEAVVRAGEASVEAKATAQGLALAAGLLSGSYHWVVTNVPYLASGKQSKELKSHCESNYPLAKTDLATVFQQRCLELALLTSVVIPQSWMFLASFKNLRELWLKNAQLESIARLGNRAFETIGGEVVNVALVTMSNEPSNKGHRFLALDASSEANPTSKATYQKLGDILLLAQVEQLNNPDNIIRLESSDEISYLSEYVDSYKGLDTGDMPLFIQQFWEGNVGFGWEFFGDTVTESIHFGGMDKVILWENGEGKLCSYEKANIRGKNAWTQLGVNVAQMGELGGSRYMGWLYGVNSASLIPKKDAFYPAVYSFIQSDEYKLEVRKIDQSLKVTNATLVKVPFDYELWERRARSKYPKGLPSPFTNDPTQWIFHGHPCASVFWDEEAKTTAVSNNREDDSVLQVAIARLLGYQWPAELDPEMELAPEMREVMKKNAAFTGLIDEDGIVCIPAVHGEYTAAKRLETILHKAYGDEWTSSVEDNLLKSVKAKDLESWLRDKFFEQHAKMFQHRPFIWQIWDGQKDGFSALVNYHKFDYKGLERLIYTYLDDWISIQKRDLAEGKDGADILLNAAENLKTQLVAILDGEKGLDIFVRWKRLAEQPIGWNPDLNDGVRLNIRPFMLAKDMGKKGAGVLRAKPNIHWKKDRGTDVESAPWFHLGLQYGGKEGDRINEHHLSLAEKRKAREEANE
ncbi:restriction endonuclease subunit M [Vibrio parahaemolyticus]|uniref:Eco57I restriction-modification methylase domain-containing protein n=2 Tax=Vibrio parahaemolyticus TaxID=670 RepID=UPI000543EE14|nr:DNA methyltransferase [Vibrio parahaemolyticus]EGR3302281.1 restriction endonuclease subunit M [Vibrio parahaemolyticus]EGR3304640.1 restriction endonuclease subunit M [Vibrio parahaemolyticus]EGR3317733.1 restriction endonuclease subunit M [Vibrio parahaemolyticus]EMA7643310.1 SAM-dependent DNA methyltransferase [Vibrio parahaemolyticus]KHF05082.1 restriction endonuclease subunit M [Vibrio parahaemolyticus]